MKRNLFILCLMLFINTIQAQIPVTDASTQMNQLIIAKSQMMQTTEQITTALENLGISSQMLENIQKQAERLKKINSTIKTIKKTTEILTLSYKITALYGNLTKAITSDGAFNDKEAALYIANVYSILGGSLDLVADVTNVVTDNVFQMSDKERIDYIEKTRQQLSENYYQMQYMAYKIATYSHQSTMADKALTDFNNFFNF